MLKLVKGESNELEEIVNCKIIGFHCKKGTQPNFKGHILVLIEK